MIFNLYEAQYFFLNHKRSPARALNFSYVTYKKKLKNTFNPTLKQRHLYFQISFKKTFLEFAFYYKNFCELLFTSSIASNFYTATSEEITNSSQKLVNKSKVNKRAFFLIWIVCYN